MPDSHLSFFRRVWKRLNIDRIARMNLHYEAIIGEILPKTKGERSELEYFTLKFLEHVRNARFYAKLRWLLYLFLYASVIVNVIKILPWLDFLVEFIQLGSALLGTTVLLVLVLWVQMKINLHLELMNESLTHLIALYHKNHKRDTETMLRKLSKTL